MSSSQESIFKHQKDKLHIQTEQVLFNIYTHIYDTHIFVCVYMNACNSI